MLENHSDSTEPLEDDLCFLGVGLDKNSEGFVSIHIQNGYEEAFSNILIGLMTGAFSEEIMSALKDYCLQNDIDIKAVVNNIEEKAKLLTTKMKQDADEIPYIKPSQVKSNSDFF